MAHDHVIMDFACSNCGHKMSAQCSVTQAERPSKTPLDMFTEYVGKYAVIDYAIAPDKHFPGAMIFVVNQSQANAWSISLSDMYVSKAIAALGDAVRNSRGLK